MTRIGATCILFRSLLALAVLGIGWLLWPTSSAAQVEEQLKVECKEGFCIIAEKDLARLAESNNKAVREVIRLRKYCREA